MLGHRACWLRERSEGSGRWRHDSELLFVADTRVQPGPLGALLPRGLQGGLLASQGGRHRWEIQQTDVLKIQVTLSPCVMEGRSECTRAVRGGDAEKHPHPRMNRNKSLGHARRGDTAVVCFTNGESHHPEQDRQGCWGESAPQNTPLSRHLAGGAGESPCPVCVPHLGDSPVGDRHSGWRKEEMRRRSAGEASLSRCCLTFSASLGFGDRPQRRRRFRAWQPGTPRLS